MTLNIRTRLTIQFTVIVSVILIIYSSGIYIFSAGYRKEEFYSRLENKAVNTARLLIKVKEVDYQLLKIIDQNTIHALFDEKVTIYDYTNRHIYNSLDNDTIQISKYMLDRIRIKKNIRFHAGKYEIIGILFRESNKSYVVLASAYDKYGRSKLNYLLWILIIGFFIHTGVAVFLGRIYAERSLRPMSDIIRQVDKITFESMHMRVNEGNSTDEIARLAMTFNRMLERLESAFEMQRSFVSHASHELRTPLTSITGQIEVALMKQRKGEDYVATLNSVLEDIRNLNKLSNSLLDLAKASSDLSAVHRQPLRIDEILWETGEELTGVKSDYNIDIQFIRPIEDDRELMVFCNRHLLKTALLNLMDNGCKFSPDKTVEVSLDMKDHQIILTFTDKGIGIDLEDLASISEPFFRAKNAGTILGSGLGLTLSARIIELHQGSLTIDSLPGKGTTVTVTIPVMQ